VARSHPIDVGSAAEERTGVLKMPGEKNTEYFEEIRTGKTLIAMIIRSDFSRDSTCFFSPDDYSQQLGFLTHPKGATIPAHRHRRVRRNVVLTQEVLVVRRGRVRANLFDTQSRFLCSRELEAGDIIFLCQGGHGFEVLEDLEMVEVKQGPYSGRASDKVLLDEIDDDSGV
jgi:hypothetical protein